MMLDQIARACRSFADRPAFLIAGVEHRYDAFARKLSAARRALDERALPPGANVGIVALDDLDTYAAIFGTLFAGHAFVPLNPTLPPERNASVVSQAGITTVLSSVAEPSLDTDGLSLIHTPALPEAEIDLSLPALAPDALAYILFTSGSTGAPKGVPISHANLSAFLSSFFDCTCELTERDRVLQMFELTFDFSIATYMTPLVRGACVCTVPREAIKYTAVIELLEDHGVTIAPMVPSILSYLRPYFDEISLPGLRHAYFCGEALHEDVVREFSACVPNALIQNFYGPTEATVFSLVYDWDPAKSEAKTRNGVVCIGKPMAGMDALRVDETLAPVEAGARGEICLCGPQVTPGYWRNPEKNAECFFTGPDGVRYYRTGDVAEADADGDLHFCGRIDHQVQIQGYRVELSEIEFHARAAAPKLNLCAVAFENHIGNAQVHLFLEGDDATVEAVSAHVARALPAYMVPTGITPLAALPLNPSGKVDRVALAALARQEMAPRG
ncbi:MAG: amino acid adenylation domain-containing protein [Myxococcales bacterium]|nr:amino acid adenylation domain-containing protein [Myxococcales bacterium]